MLPSTSKFHPNPPIVMIPSKRSFAQTSPSGSSYKRYCSNPKGQSQEEKKDMSQILSTLTAVIMAQSNAFQAHTQRFDVFAETVQTRLDIIESKCDDSLNRKQFGIMGSLGVITQEMNALRDDFLSIFSSEVRSRSRQIRRSHRSAGLSSRAARGHSQADSNDGPCQSSMMSDGDSTHGGGIVERAIARERKRLGGAPVLADGETTIHFNPRKRWSRSKVDLLDIEEESDLESDTGSSLYPMGSSPERRLTDDDDETGEEEENGEETESEEAEETESSALIREDGEGRIMEEKEPSLKRDKVLAASNGHNAGGHKWPKLGLDCTEGRMKVIDCTACDGRVHWACAGLNPEVSMLKKSWYCPSCTLLVKDLKPAIARRMREREELPRTQDNEERCLRPDCIHHQPIDITSAKADDDNLYYMSAIVGKRYTKDRPRTLQYLVQWNEWEDYDCTWEPPSNIPAVDLPSYRSLFHKQAKNENLDLSNKKTAILSRFSHYYEADGSYNVKLLKRLGVEDKDWWGW